MSMISRMSPDQRGFTIVELLVSMVCTVLLVGGAVAMTSQVQAGYRRQMEEVAAEQEGRYALDWVSRLIRSAGSNPYEISESQCPSDPTLFTGLVVDPNNDGIHNDIRLQADSNPPDELLGGAGGACNQANEDVTVRYDAGTRSITFLDNNLGGGATIRTEPVVTNLQFLYRDGDHDELTVNPIDPDDVMYVEIRITVQPRAIGNQTGNVARVMTQEVRIKGRNY